MDSLRDGKSELVNTNKLLRTYNGCTGLDLAFSLHGIKVSKVISPLSKASIISRIDITFVTLAGRNFSWEFCSYNICPVDCSIKIAPVDSKFREPLFKSEDTAIDELPWVVSAIVDQIYS